jgi:hypothetical protein
MGRIASMLVVAALALGAGGCITSDPEEAVKRPESRFAKQHAYDGPSVSPARCRPDLRPTDLDVPDVDDVARSGWTVEHVGSCSLETAPRDSVEATFDDGWISVPRTCLPASGAFQVDGRRFRVTETIDGNNDVYCDKRPVPTGFLEAIRSWGITDDGQLYLLDGDGMAIFVAIRRAEPPAGSRLRRCIERYLPQGFDASDVRRECERANERGDLDRRGMPTTCVSVLDSMPPQLQIHDKSANFCRVGSTPSAPVRPVPETTSTVPDE